MLLFMKIVLLFVKVYLMLFKFKGFIGGRLDLKRDFVFFFVFL